LLDAQLLAQVYVELTGGRQIGLGLVSEAIEEAIDFTPVVPAQIRPPRHFAASEAELARHALFVSGITKPLWGAEASG
jgi:DNA polymerase-3 subunit epsilon